MRGIVFGTWGEASPEVERLVHIFSSSGAAKHWRSMHAASPAEAKGGLAWLLRRRWAMTALRENARLKLERLQSGCSLQAEEQWQPHTGGLPRWLPVV